MSAFVGVLTACVLLLTADGQIYDTNFQTLWEATALLTGDHPYRDFYEWGLPLQAMASAVAQLLVGYRLIGEFLLQWSFIVAAMVIAFAIARRGSRSDRAAVVAALLAILIVAATATYHYPKIFFYPLAVWLAWRYLDRPTGVAAAHLGIATATAFLFRHDHGVYLGAASAMAFAFARVTAPSSRSLRSIGRDLGVYAVVNAAILMPWVLLVASGEGLRDYVKLRNDLYHNWSAKGLPQLALRDIAPLQALAPAEAGRWVPSAINAQTWLFHVSMLVPLLLAAVVIVTAIQSRRRREPVPADTWHLLLGAAFLTLIDARLFREPGYFVVAAPLTAALGAALTWAPRANRRLTPVVAPGHALARVGRGSVRLVAIALFALTALTTIVCASQSGIFDVVTRAEELRPTFRALLASPPIDGYLSLADANRIDAVEYAKGNAGDRLPLWIRYIYECSRPGDRILVTGSTPYQVGYYTERSVAGGHLFWHHEWRTDARDEMASLAMLEQQSVPFAISTADPIMRDFRRYPRIQRYLRAHYTELRGSDGMMLVDTRRKPVRTFGALGFPCFR